MGLDQWIMAKTKSLPRKDPTGVCSGIFNLIPSSIDGDIELCYLRKAYDQDNLIFRICGFGAYCGGDSEDVDRRFTLPQINEIITETKRILETHEFDTEGYDLTESEELTFMSKTKYETLLDAMEKARKLLEEDPEAIVYYETWW